MTAKRLIAAVALLAAVALFYSHYNLHHAISAQTESGQGGRSTGVTSAGSSLHTEDEICSFQENTKLGGEILEKRHEDTLDLCCASCHKNSDCHVWVYCDTDDCAGQLQECYLKQLPIPDDAEPDLEGPDVPFISGIIHSRGTASLSSKEGR